MDAEQVRKHHLETSSPENIIAPSVYFNLAVEAVAQLAGINTMLATIASQQCEMIDAIKGVDHIQSAIFGLMEEQRKWSLDIPSQIAHGAAVQAAQLDFAETPSGKLMSARAKAASQATPDDLRKAAIQQCRMQIEMQKAMPKLQAGIDPESGLTVGISTPAGRS